MTPFTKTLGGAVDAVIKTSTGSMGDFWRDRDLTDMRTLIVTSTEYIRSDRSEAALAFSRGQVRKYHKEASRLFKHITSSYGLESANLAVYLANLWIVFMLEEAALSMQSDRYDDYATYPTATVALGRLAKESVPLRKKLHSYDDLYHSYGQNHVKLEEKRHLKGTRFFCLGTWEHTIRVQMNTSTTTSAEWETMATKEISWNACSSEPKSEIKTWRYRLGLEKAVCTEAWLTSYFERFLGARWRDTVERLESVAKWRLSDVADSLLEFHLNDTRRYSIRREHPYL